jgi:endonuclease/exonuclease/phosphatase family metal-dependent hydrolase
MKKITFIFVCIFVCTGFTHAQDLVVGSYNIRNDNSGDKKDGNGWARRCPFIAQQVFFNDFDIFGAQEVLHNQLNDLVNELPSYAFVGVGRSDGKTKGEYVPIFYKRDRFQLLKSGHFWLAENTEYPAKGWDAALERICTWAEFKDRKEKKRCWFFNVHFDHIGVEARKKSAELVLEKIKEMCGKDAVILVGDFNVDQTNESYKLLADSDILNDTYETASFRYALNGTFNAFKSDLFTNSRIDHIFVSDKFKVDRYGILTDTYRSIPEDPNGGASAKKSFRTKAEVRMISDHFPVKVILYYK